MAYAVPPGEDDGLLSVLELALADRRHPLPAWVSKDDLYRDLPQTIAANCFQSTDGAGRPAWYVLTPLRAIGGRTRRTVYGAGYWKVERTTAIFLSQGGEPSSPKPAPDGSCVKLSFILRPHNGPEGRNGWLMKQYLLTKAPGTVAGPALCKLYFNNSAAAAANPAAPPLRHQPARLATSGSARPLRVPCAGLPPLLSTSAQDAGRRHISSVVSSPPPHLCTTPESQTSTPGTGTGTGRRWVLVQTEATTTPPHPQHDRGLKRIYQVLSLDEVELEEGEVIQQGVYLKKSKRFRCHESSYLMLKDVDLQRLKDAH